MKKKKGDILRKYLEEMKATEIPCTKSSSPIFLSDHQFNEIEKVLGSPLNENHRKQINEFSDQLAEMIQPHPRLLPVLGELGDTAGSLWKSLRQLDPRARNWLLKRNDELKRVEKDARSICLEIEEALKEIRERGRPKDSGLHTYIENLAMIYEEATGQEPGRIIAFQRIPTRTATFRNIPRGPFFDFIKICLEKVKESGIDTGQRTDNSIDGFIKKYLNEFGFLYSSNSKRKGRKRSRTTT